MNAVKKQVIKLELTRGELGHLILALTAVENLGELYKAQDKLIKQWGVSIPPLDLEGDFLLFRRLVDEYKPYSF